MNTQNRRKRPRMYELSVPAGERAEHVLKQKRCALSFAEELVSNTNYDSNKEGGATLNQ